MDIFWLSPDVKFNDKLLYATDMRLETTRGCPLNPEHSTQNLWTRPLKLVSSGPQLTDFEWTVFSDLIVSGPIAKELENAGFSGFRFCAVEHHNTLEEPISRQAFEMRVTGWGGVANPSSGIRVVEECAACKRKEYSAYTTKNLIFDVDRWDGSDFFVIWPLPRFIMITDEVRRFLLKQGYSGVRARPLIELPEILDGRIRPGRPADYELAECQ